MSIYKGLRKKYAHIAIKGKHSQSRKTICRSRKIGGGGQFEDTRTLKLEQTRKTKKGQIVNALRAAQAT